MYPWLGVAYLVFLGKIGIDCGIINLDVEELQVMVFMWHRAAIDLNNTTFKL